MKYFKTAMGVSLIFVLLIFVAFLYMGFEMGGGWSSLFPKKTILFTGACSTGGLELSQTERDGGLNVGKQYFNQLSYVLGNTRRLVGTASTGNNFPSYLKPESFRILESVKNGSPHLYWNIQINKKPAGTFSQEEYATITECIAQHRTALNKALHKVGRPSIGSISLTPVEYAQYDGRGDYGRYLCSTGEIISIADDGVINVGFPPSNGSPYPYYWHPVPTGFIDERGYLVIKPTLPSDQMTPKAVQVLGSSDNCVNAQGETLNGSFASWRSEHSAEFNPL